MIEVTLTTRQKVSARINPHKDGGIPITFVGVGEWGILSGEGTIESSDDGMSAEIISSDIPGVTIYLVVIDADVGFGVEEIAALVRVTTVDPNGIALSVGRPVSK